jgi:DNA-binding CsgD family transcriptional regulator
VSVMRSELRADVPPKLLEALRRAPLVPESMIDRVSASDLRRGERLSSRERDVLLLLSHGCTLAQAADALGIGYETARSHRQRARFKLRAKNVTHTVALALRLGAIQ